jgi:hypothetical protein
MQCSNQLKQIGLATHNFHDGRNGLPPLGIIRGRQGFHFFLLPYTEQNAVWEWLSSNAPITKSDGSYCYYMNDATLPPLHGLLAIPSTMNMVANTSSGQSGDGAIRCPEWFYFLPEEYKVSLSAIPYHFCPSKRSPRGADAYHSAMDWENPTTAVSDACGPRSDYAPLMSLNNAFSYEHYVIEFMTEVRTVAGLDGGSLTMFQRSDPNNQNGPFRLSANEYDEAGFSAANPGARLGYFSNSSGTYSPSLTNYITSWAPRDSFSYWADGTSNQLTIVEKHIPGWAVGTQDDKYSTWDGGIMNSYWHAECGKLFVREFIGADKTGDEIISVAKSPNQFETQFIPDGTAPLGAGNPCQRLRLDLNEGANYLLGSSHPGVFQSAGGDGSVHSLPVEIRQDILSSLTQVDDGNAVSLP